MELHQATFSKTHCLHLHPSTEIKPRPHLKMPLSLIVSEE